MTNVDRERLRMLLAKFVSDHYEDLNERERDAVRDLREALYRINKEKESKS